MIVGIVVNVFGYGDLIWVKVVIEQVGKFVYVSNFFYIVFQVNSISSFMLLGLLSMILE